MWVLFEDNIKPPKVFQPPFLTRNARFQKPAKSGSPSKKEWITNHHPKKRINHQSPSDLQSLSTSDWYQARTSLYCALFWSWSRTPSPVTKVSRQARKKKTLVASVNLETLVAIITFVSLPLSNFMPCTTFTTLVWGDLWLFLIKGIRSPWKHSLETPQMH